jgi:hypothetical protein
MSRNILGRFAEVTTQLAAGQRTALKAAAEIYRARLAHEAPRSQPSPGKPSEPHLADGFRARIEMRGEGIMDVQIYATGPHAQYLPIIIHGSRPHQIRARNASVLRFFWTGGPKGAGFYFYRSVNHPGTRPNPFPKRAWDGVRGQVLAELHRIAERAYGGSRG